MRRYQRKSGSRRQIRDNKREIRHIKSLLLRCAKKELKNGNDVMLDVLRKYQSGEIVIMYIRASHKLFVIPRDAPTDVRLRFIDHKFK